MRQLIYRAKHRFGKKIRLYTSTVPGDAAPNFLTGALSGSNNRTVQLVRKALILKGDHTHNFVYDLSFIAANKNFTMGGFFEKEAFTFIIDAKDIVTAPDPSGYVTWDKQKFEIKSASRQGENICYIIRAQYIPGAKPLDIFEEQIDQSLTLSHVVTI